MTLKEELEILRGEPIAVFTGDPMDIPCIETSDPEKLCKQPIVSVYMITYNHEPYIRQAIEGVMMQKADFQFELVIGEDCSQDKTREICFEYQKKYPDKIRVLWWHKNLYRNPHSAGGNGRRVIARCRGEFIAFCEGDDYWIDPLKLQKQVEIMRANPHVGLCFARSKINVVGDMMRQGLWNEKNTFKAGNVSGREFYLKHLFGVCFDEGLWGSATFLMTASTMIRSSTYRDAVQRYEIFSWRLCLGDSTIWLGITALSDAFYLDDVVSVYNQTPQGFCRTIGSKISRDAQIIRLYFFCKYYGRSLCDLPTRQQKSIYESAVINRADVISAIGYRAWRREMTSTRFGVVLFNKNFLFLDVIYWLCNRVFKLLGSRYISYILNERADSDWVVKEYEDLGLEYRNDGSSIACRMFMALKNKFSKKPVDKYFHFVCGKS